MNEVASATHRQLATNQTGFNVEVLSSFGWRVVGFRKPYRTHEAATAAMAELIEIDSMEREYRMYAALAARA